MNLLKVLKQLARRRGAARINAEAPTRLVERAEVKKSNRTATLPTTTASVAEIVEPEA